MRKKQENKKAKPNLKIKKKTRRYSRRRRILKIIKYGQCFNS